MEKKKKNSKTKETKTFLFFKFFARFFGTLFGGRLACRLCLEKLFFIPYDAILLFLGHGQLDF